MEAGQLPSKSIEDILNELWDNSNARFSTASQKAFEKICFVKIDIYDKSEQSTLTDKELKKLIEEIENELWFQKIPRACH